jgi:hypothetical protein
MSKIFLVAILAVFIGANPCNKNNKSAFEKIIFHSTGCMGSCPALSLEVDSSKTIKIHRQFYKGKAVPINENSGDFQGILDQNKFDEILKIIESIKYDSLKFPEIYCCDASIKTIIVYDNGKRTYLRSMMPPKETEILISYLESLASGIELPRSKDKLKIEE